jgi:polysaccharide export outer membrane protein
MAKDGATLADRGMLIACTHLRSAPRPAPTARVPRRAAALALLAGALGGCAARGHEHLVAFLQAHEQCVATGQYTLMPPDAVAIHAPVAPEIDGTVHSLRPDGKIAVRLLGEVDLAGLTTEQAADKIRAHLARYYVEPDVVVDVANYASQFYYVFGQVASPGPKPFTGRDTLLLALARAQPTFLAWRSRIRVIRPPTADASDAAPHVLTIDLDRMVRAGALDQNVLLQPGDVIEVPPTPLGWLGLRLRELLFPVTPALDAYETPADAIDSTRVYEYEFEDQRDAQGRWRRRSR